jgi:hypothetical protein
MSEEKKESLPFRIVIEYDPSGKFSLQSNFFDEVLTFGMIDAAREKFKENQQLNRIKEIEKKRASNILVVQ